MEVLSATQLRKEYAGREPTLALKEVSFSCAAGEFVSIVGPSGCGKTTVLRILAGLMPASSGDTMIRGRPIDGPPRESALVFQEYGRSLLPWRTVHQNIALPLETTRRPRGERSLRVRNAVSLVGLDGFENHYSWQLSGGMQQRVAIARALASEPEILLMDEPFGSLDARMREDLEDELLRLWEQLRFTVVFVTHDLEEALYMSDRIIVLSPRPATVQQEIDVRFPRPRRQLETRSSPDFLHLRQHAHGLLRQ